MAAQDPGRVIVDAIAKGRVPPPPPRKRRAVGEDHDVAMAEAQTQDRFVGPLRPSAQTYTGRPELCWTFWLKGWALTETVASLPGGGRSGTVEGIPEAEIKAYMRIAFGNYLEWAVSKGFFPAMVQLSLIHI